MANSILAAILSFLIPGLGQFYAGSLMKGIGLFVVWIIIALIITMIFKQWIYYIVNILYSLFAAYDAYNMANLQ